MESVDIHEAKTRLSQRLDRAAAGEDVAVSRQGKPLARIIRLLGDKRPIRFGVLKGKLHIASDFDAPLPGELLDAFGVR